MEFRQKCWLALVLGSDRGDRGEGSEVTEMLAACQTLRVHVCALVYYVLLCCRPWPSDQPPCIPALLIKALCLFLFPNCGVTGRQKQRYLNQPLKKMAVANEQPCSKQVHMSQCCLLCPDDSFDFVITVTFLLPCCSLSGISMTVTN